MEDKLKNLNEKMNHTIFNHIHFNHSNKQYVLREIKKDRKVRFSLVSRTWKYALSASVSTALLAGITFFAFNQLTPIHKDESLGIEKKLAVSKPEKSTYTPEKKEEYFGEMTKKQILTKMLNTIDYYDTAKGSFEEETQDYKLVVNYQLSLEEDVGGYNKTDNYSKQHEQRETRVDFYDENNLYAIFPDDKIYREVSYVKPTRCCTLTPEQAFVKNADGLDMTSSRDRPPIGVAQNSLFPYEIASNYTRDFNKWEIEKQNEMLIGHNTLVIKGNIDEYASEKHGSKTFRFWVDKDTGILIQYETYNEKGEVVNYLRSKELFVNVPIETKKLKPNLKGYFRK